MSKSHPHPRPRKHDRGTHDAEEAVRALDAERAKSVQVPPAEAGSADLDRFGRVLKELRHDRGMTLEQLSERVGVTRGYLSMIENGRVGNPPSRRVLKALEIVLEVEDDTLAAADRWDRTPEAIRAELLEMRARAARNEALLSAVRGASADHAEPDADAAARIPGGKLPGVDLDSLYRDGVLSRWVGGDAVGGGGDGLTPAEAGSAGGRAGAFVAGLVFPQVPVINKVAAGLPSGFTDLDYPPGSGEDVVLVPGYTGRHGQNDPDAFAAVIHGQSMSPAYRDGDIVVFSPLADITDGCDCYARLEPDHETTFKKVYFEADGERIRLEPINPDYATRTVDREQVAGLFRAVWRMSRV